MYKLVRIDRFSPMDMHIVFTLRLTNASAAQHDKREARQPQLATTPNRLQRRRGLRGERAGAGASGDRRGCCLGGSFSEEVLLVLRSGTPAGLPRTKEPYAVARDELVDGVTQACVTCGVACGVWRVACGVWRVACGVWRGSRSRALGPGPLAGCAVRPGQRRERAIRARL